MADSTESNSYNISENDLKTLLRDEKHDISKALKGCTQIAQYVDGDEDSDDHVVHTVYFYRNWVVRRYYRTGYWTSLCSNPNGLLGSCEYAKFTEPQKILHGTDSLNFIKKVIDGVCEEAYFIDTPCEMGEEMFIDFVREYYNKE